MGAERQALPDRRARPEFLTGDNVWLAIGPCGCGYAIDTCDDRDAQANVAGWRAEGSTVVQVPIEEARERLVLDCPHEPRYGLLPVSEARAEAIRLRAENENLKANISAIFDQAVEIHENPHPLMSFADYLRYRLGTAGHAYHVQGVADLIEERDAAAQDADRRSCQGGWNLAQERAVRALKAEWEVERLREIITEHRAVVLHGGGGLEASDADEALWAALKTPDASDDILAPKEAPDA